VRVAGSYAPTPSPGEEFAVCVAFTAHIPLRPELVEANTAASQFLVESDRYVDS
jgi:hypothetical protein